MNAGLHIARVTGRDDSGLALKAYGKRLRRAGDILCDDRRQEVWDANHSLICLSRS